MRKKIAFCLAVLFATAIVAGCSDTAPKATPDQVAAFEHPPAPPSGTTQANAIKNMQSSFEQSHPQYYKNGVYVGYQGGGASTSTSAAPAGAVAPGTGQ
jgi:ABC-type glycerol-3-phosphate transport system substrate-binding protein